MAYFNWPLAAGLGAVSGLCGRQRRARGCRDRGQVSPTRRPRRGACTGGRAEAAPACARHGNHLGGHCVPAQDEAKHFKLIGTTGTGKSTAIQEILSEALARGDRAVIADPDGGYLRRFYRPDRGDVVLNPFDERSVKWDLFAEIRNAYDVEQLARSLIPDHDGQDRSWRGYARTFFTAVTRQAHEAGVKDVDELYRLLVVADTGELRALVRGTPAQPFLDEHNSRMFDSIRSVTSSAVGALEYIAQADKPRDFSIREWVEREDSRRVVHALQGRADRGAALDHFRLDAPGDFRNHGSGTEPRTPWRGNRPSVVRRR